MNTQCMQTRLEPGAGLISAAGRTESGTRSWLKGLYARVAGSARRLALSFDRAQSRRAAIRELSRLSDGQLADIGISRGQIREVVDGLMRKTANARRR